MSPLAASLLLAVVFAGLGLGFGRVLAPHLVSQAYRKPGDLPSRRALSRAQGAGACVIGAGWVGGTTAASRPLLAAALLIVSVVAVWVSVVDLDVHRIPNRASGLAALTSFGYVGVDAVVSGQYGRALLAFGAVIVVVAAGLGVAALGGAGLGDVKLLALLVPVPVYLGVAALVLVCVGHGHGRPRERRTCRRTARSWVVGEAPSRRHNHVRRPRLRLRLGAPWLRRGGHPNALRSRSARQT